MVTEYRWIANLMPTFRNGRLAQAVLLFTNFFLIITALYHLKPASRSIFVTALGSDRLPYVWIATAVGLGLLITVYHRLIERHSRLNVVLATCAIIIACLIGFYPSLPHSAFVLPFAFYIFVDMLSVVLVEQFWSLTNTAYSTDQGKRWYGLIATGGLLGGVAGGVLSATWVERLGLDTFDLLPVAAGIVALLMLLSVLMGRLGLYVEQPGVANHDEAERDQWHFIAKHRYLFLIAAILLLAQVVEPLVEFQFMKMVETHIEGREARTVYLADVFGILSAVAIAVNLLITPLIHRWLGALGGLFAQPLSVMAGSLYFMSNATLLAGSALKIADRGLSYSINRASKELLYIPIDPVLIFKAKAWIDMFGYRMFKVLGSLLILLLTQWLPWSLSARDLGWLVLATCLLWMYALVRLGGEYRRVSARAAAAAP